jgi:hypothetical protein
LQHADAAAESPHISGGHAYEQAPARSVQRAERQQRAHRNDDAEHTVAPYLSADPNAGGLPTSILQPRIIRLGAQLRF